MEVPLYLCGLVQFCYPGESDCGGATVPLWSGAVLLSDLKVYGEPSLAESALWGVFCALLVLNCVLLTQTIPSPVI